MNTNPELNEKTVESVISAYLNSGKNWYLAYSGGKDSSATLKVLYNALLRLKVHNKRVGIIYCDTGVEMPVIRDYAMSTLTKLEEEARIDGLPIDIIISKPDMNDRFFVNVLGRGYMPPSFMFRWCTDRLRIKPLRFAMDNTNNLVLLGTRKHESAERERTLKKYEIEEFYFEQKKCKSSMIYSPIVNYSVADVWKCLKELRKPYSIDIERLEFLYE